MDMKTCRKLAAATAIAMIALPCAGLAQSNAAESRIGRWYIGGGFGAFAEEDNAQLGNQDAAAALFFSGGYRASANIAIEADGLGWNQDFATPATISPGLISSAEARSDLTTAGISAVIKFIAPLRAVDLYAGVGLGFYNTNLSVEGTGASAGLKIDETETDLGYQLLVGTDVYVSRRISVGLEYRWLKLDTNFEPYIAGELDTGGQFFLMNVRGHF